MLVIVHGDEWEGLYEDGILITEHHHVTESVLDRCGIVRVWLTPQQDRHLREVGRLPENLNYLGKGDW